MSKPVFLDPTGRRWRHVRRVLLGVGVGTTLLAFALIVFALVPPALPSLAAVHGDWQLARLPVWRGTRAARQHAVARRRLLASLSRHQDIAARRPSTITPRALSSATAATSSRSDRAPGEFAAFYVNWDDNAFASLSAHASAVDWVVAEWAFVVPSGDSLHINIDRRVPFLLSRMPVADRPRVLAMVSNIDSATQKFDQRRLQALVGQPASRQRAVAQLVTLVHQWGLSGVTVDFEDIPDALHPAVRQFLSDLRHGLNAVPRPTDAPALVVTQAVGVDLASDVLRQYATLNDRLFLMVYDEHYGKGDPGPVASQWWYEQQARNALRVVPAAKAVLAIGAYGYDWNDGGPQASGEAMTFQDVMRTAREHQAPLLFDRKSLNPYVQWTDADSTDHVVWYLDGVTAWNQMAVGRLLGVRGHALWRLGAEDPSVWNALAVIDTEETEKRLAAADAPLSVAALHRIEPGYDVEFNGDGELLRIQQRPHDGQRTTTFDSTLGVIVGQQTMAYSTPWIVQRFGAQPHKVALTFDDGPDAHWTPAILDTLRSRGVKATFFVIGTQVEGNMALTRRLVTDGHEVGNHTFSHPNLALLPDRIVGMEIDVNERLLEAALDQRVVFFRAPYFGDAEPTTADELVPAAIASDRGYVIAGLHVDSQDWQRPGISAIIRNVLGQRVHGNVVLLHDGGGDRAQTLAALGPLIDSLRSRGDTLVPLSALAGGTVRAMVPLPVDDESARSLALAGFMMIGSVEWVLMWLFLIAVVLGIARVLLVSVLAMIQFVRERRAAAGADAAMDGDAYAPSVAVLVPAYNESAVIVRTVETLLSQTYSGVMEILVIDDGSSDDTYAVAHARFANDPRVQVYSKPNGGKASALNFGLHIATADVVIGLDADTLFESDTIAKLVQPLHNPAVAAVAGNAKVGNRLNLITRWQAIEYITSQNLDRRAFALLNGITVVPGAVGAWRRDLVLTAGGFSHDTLAEDQDLTLTLLKSGYRVAYAPQAIAWTEAPDTVKGLLKQRFRWSYGTLQCMWKHRQALLKPRYGSLGMIALPNTWIFQLLVNAVAPLADLMFLWTLLSVWLIGIQHGETYAVTALHQVLVLYAVFLLLDWGVTVLAVITEPREEWRLTWLVFLQRFAYRQMMYWVVVRSFVAAARGGLIGWGKLERKATVQLPIA